jgi:hypothetical protein
LEANIIERARAPEPENDASRTRPRGAGAGCAPPLVLHAIHREAGGHGGVLRPNGVLGVAFLDPVRLHDRDPVIAVGVGAPTIVLLSAESVYANGVTP